MKTRQGFVSNSSSSSFVILVEESTHEKVMEKLTEYQRACMEKLAGKPQNIFGRNVIVIGEATDMGGNSSLIEEGWQPEGWEEKIEKLAATGEDEDYYPSEALYAYTNAVEKQPKSAWFKWDADM
jgi:hypothetical protein